MTMYFNYPTKKGLKEQIGQELDYEETSIFGPEYKSTGSFVGCNERRSYFAQVTMKNDLIVKVI